jgi:hypothetical protein
MSVRWQFIEAREGGATCWSWRVVLVDGTIETHSQPFKSYGAAVGDAIRNGFRPTQHHWIVVTRHTATHFRPGEPHVSVPVVGEAEEGRNAVLPPHEKPAAADDQRADEQPKESNRPVRQ